MQATFSERVEELRQVILSAEPEDRQKLVDHLNASLDMISAADNFPAHPERMISDERLAELNAELDAHRRTAPRLLSDSDVAEPAINAVEQAEREVYDRLERAFGGLLNLPRVAIDEPKWLDAGYKEDRAMQRKLEMAGLDRITQAGRIRYHEQLREGQGYDDGCGFRLRCWMAALRYPFQPAWSSRSPVGAPRAVKAVSK